LGEPLPPSLMFLIKDGAHPRGGPESGPFLRQANGLTHELDLAGKGLKVFCKCFQCHACIGGTNLGEDIRKLDYGQHIVSGTPGRVFDMIR
jgi:hypothetical protein